MFVIRSMTAAVITIDPDADIVETKEKMEQHHVRHLPVVDDKNRLIGIVSDRDIRSALPSRLKRNQNEAQGYGELSGYNVKDIMSRNPTTVSPSDTIQDALLLIQRQRVGALPVIDADGILKGIISVRDLLRGFVNVLGIEEPGTLLCIIASNKVGDIKKIVDTIAEENISVGSILVARHGEEGKRAVYPYLLTIDTRSVKAKLAQIGFTLIDPMGWDLEEMQKHEDV
jgi:acetoin utilization protein AcuB